MTSVVVTHDMNTARKVADRVVMLYPLAGSKPDESQIMFDGPPSELDDSTRPPRDAIHPRRSGRTDDGTE